MITLHARLEKRPKPHARKTAQGRAQESTNAGEPLLEFRTTSIYIIVCYIILLGLGLGFIFPVKGLGLSFAAQSLGPGFGFRLLDMM